MHTPQTQNNQTIQTQPNNQIQAHSEGLSDNATHPCDTCPYYEEPPKPLPLRILSGLGLAILVLLTVGLISLLATFYLGGVTLYRVDGPSMEPAAVEGDILLVRPETRYHRYDLVIAKDPNGEVLVKRLIGLPGDTVTFLDGQLYVNGKLVKESYVHDNKEGSQDLQVTLQDDQYFVAGDHRSVSRDSRTFGPLSGAQLRGTVFYLWH